MRTCVNTFTRSCTLLLLILAIKGKTQNFPLFAGGLSPSDNGQEYTSSTIFLSGANTAFTTFNIIRLMNGDKHRSNAWFGLLMGTAQVSYESFANIERGKNAQILSSVNIGLGMTTILTSILRLAKKNRMEKNKVSYQLLCNPSNNKYAFEFTYRIGRP